MPLTNREIADTFDRVADMLQIRGDIIHRVLSYRRAAETIRDLPRDLRAIAAEDALTDLPNIGKTLADKINEMLNTEQLAFYNKLAEEIPPTLVDVMHINGVGPKKAKLFWEQLDIKTIEQLKAAAEAGKLRDLPRMGEKSEKQVLAGIEALSRRTGRTPLGVALPAAEEMLQKLLALPEAIEGAVAGSIRRGRPTIGDVDILIASDNAAPIMDTFVAMPTVARVLGHGPTKSSVELHNGLQVDLRVLEKARWGTALNYFTGSQAHNIRMRELALQKGYSLNEHAFRPLDDKGDDGRRRVAVRLVRNRGRSLRTGWPTLHPAGTARRRRRDRSGAAGQAAETDYAWTTSSPICTCTRPGATASSACARWPRQRGQRGRKYIVITDHSQYSTIANGMSVERIMQQREEVRQVDADMGPDFKVFHGVEMDIRSDGTLDYPDEVLAQLDFVIASLHFSLQPGARSRHAPGS